jgi:CRISPR/Cas system-associated endonuclease/helicase Cas3
MSIKEVITELNKKGYDVSYYKRKDGGYRITRINGEHFSGSAGNVRARLIVGTTLSEARARALSKLKTPKGKGSYNKRRKQALDPETKKRIQKLQRQYRKNGKQEGKPTIRNYRYVEKTKGKAEAERLLRQAERRILGLAYVENVEALLTRIYWDLAKKKDSSIESIYNRIESLKYNFKDKWIPAIYEILYDWERNIITGQEAERKILAIIM